MDPMTHRHGFFGRSRVGRSDPGRTPWLGLAGTCTAASAAAAVLLAAAALAFTGPAAAASVAFAAVIVIAFFALSLLAGHLVGRRNPSGAIGVFAVVYVLKIVGFAGILLWMGTPAWIARPWFGAAGIASVVVWQAAELYGFSRLRLQIFNDAPAPGDAGGDAAPSSGKEGPHA
jgi:ATP synthase protein I